MRTRLAGAALLATAALIPASAAVARPLGDAQVSKAKPVITLSGSTSVAPLASKLIKGYLKAKPGVAEFKLAQGGSDVGVADVGAGRVSIGNSSRDAKPTDPGGLVWHKIANLSQAQVQDIFSGKVRDWSQVQGSTKTGPIDLIVRTAASGTQDAFQKLFMINAKVASNAAQKASNGLVAAAVKSDPNAIGYLSYAFTSGLNDTAYQGVACNLRTAKAGQYPGSRNFWMITRGAPTKPVSQFLNWIAKNSTAQKIISSEWVPLK
jgi:phosphate transport system substrate-binding protein